VYWYGPWLRRTMLSLKSCDREMLVVIVSTCVAWRVLVASRPERIASSFGGGEDT
jgi:hypothetical protein